MGTKAKSDPSWIDRWKARGVAALTAVAVVLGIGSLNTPDPSPKPSSSATLAQDPVSPDGHYATWRDYAKSIECKGQQIGQGPPGETNIHPSCSQIFAHVHSLNSDAPTKDTNNTTPHPYKFA